MVDQLCCSIGLSWYLVEYPESPWRVFFYLAIVYKGYEPVLAWQMTYIQPDRMQEKDIEICNDTPETLSHCTGHKVIVYLYFLFL